jgi:hypothetical protein
VESKIEQRMTKVQLPDALRYPKVTPPKWMERNGYLYARDPDTGAYLDTRRFPPVPVKGGLPSNHDNFQRYTYDDDYDYDDYADYDEEEMTIINETNQLGEASRSMTLTFTSRVTQVKSGHIGQILMGNKILWETAPYQDTDEQTGVEQAFNALNQRVVLAMQTLFDVVPEVYYQKELAE